MSAFASMSRKGAQEVDDNRRRPSLTSAVVMMIIKEEERGEAAIIETKEALLLRYSDGLMAK